MSTLRFLQLIDPEGKPTPILRSLVGGLRDEKWQSELMNILQRSYPPLIRLNLAQITGQQLNESFKQNYKAKDDVIRKCQKFFLEAAKEAGIEISSRVLRNRRTPRPRRRAGTAYEGQGHPISPINGRMDLASNEGLFLSLYQTLNQSQMTEEEQQAVWTLIKFLRRKRVDS